MTFFSPLAKTPGKQVRCFPHQYVWEKQKGRMTQDMQVTSGRQDEAPSDHGGDTAPNTHLELLCARHCQLQ